MIQQLKKALQQLLRGLGYKLVRMNSVKAPVNIETVIPEITPEEKEILETCMQYSMTGPERLWSVIQSMKIINHKSIEGDLVECGVWKGGNVLMYLRMSERLNKSRKVWAYDTYEGMSEPTEEDTNLHGVASTILLDKAPKIAPEGSHNIWCYSTLEEVKSNVERHSSHADQVHYIEGKVEDTLQHPENLPEKIAILRIDTDWYESTKMCLEKLYPRLVPGGILIMDDYGHWQGARKAFDEYFAGKNIYLHRVDYTCRLMVKD